MKTNKIKLPLSHNILITKIMPVLTQDEFDDLNQRLINAEDGLKEVTYDLEEANDKAKREKNQKSIFLVMSVVFFLLLVAATSVYFFQPDLLAIDGHSLAEDEIVVKHSEISGYQDQIAQLTAQVNELSKRSHPLDNGEFYAVQLGAFKKFNTRLSSESYTIVNNANFKDFNLYTLGVFDTKEEAEKLRDIVRRLNFRDAFVGYYQDGVRVEK